MPTRQQLEDALISAHESGDTDAAQVLANEIKALKPEKPWYQKDIPGLGIPLVSEAGLTSDLKRGAGLTVRTGLNAIAALPNMASDIGVAARNVLTGSNYQLPSQMWQESLTDVGLPEPQGMAEKGADLLGQMLLGSKLPVPQAAQQAPSNYAAIDPVRLKILEQSQQLGLKVPPSTTNPTMANRFIESLGGKKATEQDFRVANQAVFDRLAGKALKQHPDLQLTRSVLGEVRKEAGDAYNAIRSVGTMRADSAYADDLSKIASKYVGAEKDFPEIAKSEVTSLVQSMQKKSFDSGAALDAIKILRGNADDAYAAGNKTLGAAYKDVSKALEDAVERSLSRRGTDSAKLLKNFKDARSMIAKTYTVEKALNDAAGSVDAQVIGRQLAKGAPLTGELKQIGQFANAFPAASKLQLDSGGVRALDAGVGMVGAAVTKEPSLLAYPFSRMAARDLLMSRLGQWMAVPSNRPPLLPASPAAQAINNLFSGQAYENR